MESHKDLIYTIGHSNLPIDKLIELLKNHSIAMVFDIRSIPYSRFPQFNRENLMQTFDNLGITYIWEGETLGGRIQDPYKAKIVPDRKTNIAELIDYDYLIGREWFQNGITGLIEVSRQKATVIMCSEENPARCHRSLLVGRRLIELGVKVCHIRGDGRLETATIENNPPPNQQKLFDGLL